MQTPSLTCLPLQEVSTLHQCCAVLWFWIKHPLEGSTWYIAIYNQQRPKLETLAPYFTPANWVFVVPEIDSYPAKYFKFKLQTWQQFVGSLRVLKHKNLLVLKQSCKHTHTDVHLHPPFWASTSVYYIQQWVWIIPIPRNEHEKLNIHKLYLSVNCTHTLILKQFFSKKIYRVRNSHFQN
jgi:hypothetical protein